MTGDNVLCKNWYLLGEKKISRVKCLAQGLEPGPLDPESTLKIREVQIIKMTGS